MTPDDLVQIEYSGDVLFHIGPHKTGTTSIQMFLKRNSNSLIDRGILYPIGGRRTLGDDIDLSPAGKLLHYHHPLITDLLTKDTKKVNAHIRRIQSEIDEHQPRQVVISSEVLARPPVTGSFVYEDLRRIFAHADRSWCLYLRRQDDLLVSRFTEQLKYGKNPWPKSILESENIEALDHKSRLQKIVSAIGADRLIVRSFEREKSRIIESFLEDLNIYSTEDFSYADKERQSASARAINLQRHANRLPPKLAKFARRWALKLDRSLTYLGAKSESAHSLLSDKDRRQFLEKYIDGNRYVEKVFFDGEESGLLLDRRD